MQKNSASKRISARIATRIRRDVASGTLAPGTRLPAERELARRLGVSRVTVREAYRSLEELHVITVRRGSEGGAFIATPDAMAIQKHLSVMLRLGGMSRNELDDASTVEPVIARLAARNARPADLSVLNRIVAREEAALHSDAHASHDPTEFRRAIARCARNLPLAALLYALADIEDRSEAPSGEQPEWRCRSHRAIVDAIARHDEDAAFRLTEAAIARRASTGRPIAGAPDAQGGESERGAPLPLSYSAITAPLVTA